MLKNILKSYDYSMIITYILLSLFGLIMIYSSSMVMAIQWYQVPADFFFQKQKINLLLAGIAFIFFAVLPYKIFRNKKILVTITLLSVVGLIAVSIIGHTTNNAQSWITLFGLRNIQPSEFVKLSVIIYLSAVFANKQSYIDQLNKGVLPPILYLIFVCFLIKIEPDNGTALITLMIGIMIIICSGMHFKTIAKLILLCLVLGLVFTPFIIWQLDAIFTEGNMKRITGFLDPFGTASDEGLQLVNSYFAIGAGGLKGLGLGQGIQKMGYLPEAHTDFIMSIIAEELGLLGVVVVLGGIGFIILRGIHTGIKTKDPFGSMLAIGISSMIGIQSFINLGGITGIIPITGVPLPFISYGGSSIIVLSIAMGILSNVAMFKNYEKNYKHNKEAAVDSIRQHSRHQSVVHTRN